MNSIREVFHDLMCHMNGSVGVLTGAVAGPDQTRPHPPHYAALLMGR